MKQRFEQVDAGGSPTAARPESGTLPSDPGSLSLADTTARTPASSQGAWLSEALKLWCADPHAPH